jgi:hypothetical protein
MPAKIDHPCFEQPEDQNVLLWRYMDFTKFFSLISSGSLFLSRADLLGDPFEGSYSKANITLRPKVYKEWPEKALEQFLKKSPDFSKYVRQWTYINCWHMSEHESAAMWKLYAKTNEAVAVQATYTNLINSLPDQVYVGVVKYIDYEKDWLPEGNTFYPFMHKRKSFSHENEVRIVNQKLPTTDKGIDLSQPNDLRGIEIEVDLNLLIDNVFVAPTAPNWYLGLVEELLKKYKLNKKIFSSKLDEKPVY